MSKKQTTLVGGRWYAKKFLDKDSFYEDLFIKDTTPRFQAKETMAALLKSYLPPGEVHDVAVSHELTLYDINKPLWKPLGKKTIIPCGEENQFDNENLLELVEELVQEGNDEWEHANGILQNISSKPDADSLYLMYHFVFDKDFISNDFPIRYEIVTRVHVDGELIDRQRGFLTPVYYYDAPPRKDMFLQPREFARWRYTPLP